MVPRTTPYDKKNVFARNTPLFLEKGGSRGGKTLARTIPKNILEDNSGANKNEIGFLFSKCRKHKIAATSLKKPGNFFYKKTLFFRFETFPFITKWKKVKKQRNGSDFLKRKKKGKKKF